MSPGDPLAGRGGQHTRTVLSRRCTAQALLWVALMMPLLVGVAGLAIDGAVAFTARRELQSVADGAARAGATRVDLTELRASGGVSVQLIQGTGADSAEAAARGYIAQRAPLELSWASQMDPPQIRVEPQRIEVTLQGRVPTAFMRIVALNSMPMSASASANARHGIEAELP